MLFTPTAFNCRVEDQLISWIVCDCEQHGWPVPGLSEGHWLGGDSMTGNWNASIGPSGLRLAFPQLPLVLRLPGHCFLQSVEQKLKPT